MRVGLSKAVHLNNQRRHLHHQLMKGEGAEAAVQQERIAKITDELFTLLVEELVHQSRDITTTQVRARRPF